MLPSLKMMFLVNQTNLKENKFPISYCIQSIDFELRTFNLNKVYLLVRIYIKLSCQNSFQTSEQTTMQVAEYHVLVIKEQYLNFFKKKVINISSWFFTSFMFTVIYQVILQLRI